jgi:hypothetical protein
MKVAWSDVNSSGNAIGKRFSHHRGGDRRRLWRSNPRQALYNSLKLKHTFC